MMGTLGLHWQWFAAVCTLPAALAAALVFTVLPESPRFLHVKGNVLGATESLLTIARWNGRASRLSQGWALDAAAELAGCESGGSGSSSGGAAGSGSVAYGSGGGAEEHEAAGLLGGTVSALTVRGGTGGEASGTGGGAAAKAVPLAPPPFFRCGKRVVGQGKGSRGGAVAACRASSPPCSPSSRGSCSATPCSFAPFGSRCHSGGMD